VLEPSACSLCASWNPSAPSSSSSSSSPAEAPGRPATGPGLPEAEAAPLLRLLRRAARLGAPAPRGSTRPHSPAAPRESLKIAWNTDMNEASERARERGLLVVQQLGHALCALGRLLGARALVERGGRGLGRADVRWRRAAWVVWKSPSVLSLQKMCNSRRRFGDRKGTVAGVSVASAEGMGGAARAARRRGGRRARLPARGAGGRKSARPRSGGAARVTPQRAVACRADRGAGPRLAAAPTRCPRAATTQLRAPRRPP